MTASIYMPDQADISQDDLAEMLASQAAAIDVVRGALKEIATGASLMADAVRCGATLHYAAAGSSGLMALADASELTGTFGISQAQIAAHMAGGAPINGVMPGDTEDSTEDARRDAAAITETDVAIVVSASGTTPYALAFAETAQARGAKVIGIANKPGSALLLSADVAITLPTAPEYIEGSTRLGAGTAQKVSLNMMSTQMGILLGHVHDRMMVNLKPDNIKLRKRAADIVCRIAGVSDGDAERALEQTGYNTKAATLVARGASVERALFLLHQHNGMLSACLLNEDGPNSARTQNQL